MANMRVIMSQKINDNDLKVFVEGGNRFLAVQPAKVIPVLWR